MRIGFFGDIHGQKDAFYEMLLHVVACEKISAAVQVGDFGISKRTLNEKKLRKLSVPLYVIDGNHEDFRFLWRALDKNMTEKWGSHNLYYQQRGSAVDIGDIRIGFIGGALHVDQPQQREQGNVITDDDINKSWLEFSAKPPHVIVSHSCPAGIGIGMMGEPFHSRGVTNYIINAGFDPGPKNDYGETQLTDLWRRMEKHPKLWIYGHFHEFQENKIQDTQFICAPCIHFFHQFIIWDTDSDQVMLKSWKP